MTAIPPCIALDKRQLPGVLREAGTLGTRVVPRSMVAGYTDPYLIKVDGDCLSPEVNDGDPVVASPDAPVIRGKLVVLYPKDGGKPSVKRAIMIPPPSMMEVHPDSEIMPLVIVEQLNPPREYRIDVDKLEAVHGVLGVIPRGEAKLLSTAAEAAQSSTPTVISRWDGKRTRTVVPRSRALSISSDPPCNSTSALVSGRPSPVPSWRRVNDPPTWTKGSKAVAMSSAAMPIPVSETRIKRPSPGSTLAVKATVPPEGVNLIAFESRLISICFSLRSSARNEGSPSGSSLCNVSPAR